MLTDCFRADLCNDIPCLYKFPLYLTILPFQAQAASPTLERDEHITYVSGAAPVINGNGAGLQRHIVGDGIMFGGNEITGSSNPVNDG